MKKDNFVHPSNRLRIAYVFTRFPTITETFVLREILQLQRHGTHIDILSLRKPRSGSLMHPEAAALLPHTFYASWLFSLRLWAVHFRYLMRHPDRYFTVLGKLIIMSFKQPGLFFKTLSIFPKSVYFASIVQQAGIAHIHSAFASHNATCALIIAKLNRVTYSVAAHAYDIIVDNPLLRERLSNAAFITTISEYNIRIIKDRYGEDIGSHTFLIRCGVDLNYFRPRLTPTSSRNDTFTILCIASLRTVKGHAILLKAIAAMETAQRNIQCVLVGDGPLRGKLGELVSQLRLQKVVIFAGNQTQQEVLNWLHHADCVVLSSHREGIPVSLMEAMACEVPVVTTNASPSVAELVVHGENGLIVEPRDAQALAKALSFVRDNPDIAAKYGKAGRKVIEEKYNIEVNAIKLLNIMKRTVYAHDSVKDEVL